MSQSRHHLKLVSRACRWLQFTPKASSSQTSIQQSAFEIRCNIRFTAWKCGWKICRNCLMLSSQHGPKSLTNVSTTLLIQRDKFYCFSILQALSMVHASHLCPPVHRSRGGGQVGHAIQGILGKFLPAYRNPDLCSRACSLWSR